MESTNKDQSNTSSETSYQKFDNFINLPLEIQIKIFKYLNPSNFDICLKVCKTWRTYIVKNIFATKLCQLAKKYKSLRTVFRNEGWYEECDDEKIISKLYYEHRLFSNGKYLILYKNKIEAVDMFDPRFKWTFPVRNKWLFSSECSSKTQFATVIRNKVLIFESHKYHIMGSPSITKAMLKPKHGFAGVVIDNKEKLWIVGGSLFGNTTSKSSTEFITLDNDPTQGPDLPFNISGHKVIQVNENSIYIIGGNVNGSPSSRRTWIVNPKDNFKMKEGPQMNFSQSGFFGVAKMIIDGQTLIVVASCNENVDILHPNENKWLKGPQLPVGSNVLYSNLVTAPDFEGVIWIGTERMPEDSNKRFMLKLNGRSMEWELLEEKTMTDEELICVVPIPSDLTC